MEVVGSKGSIKQKRPHPQAPRREYMLELVVYKSAGRQRLVHRCGNGVVGARIRLPDAQRAATELGGEKRRRNPAMGQGAVNAGQLEVGEQPQPQPCGM